MPLEGIDYNTVIKDLVWDDIAMSPQVVVNEDRVVRDLIETIWTQTDLTTIVGSPNIATLARAQNYAAQANAIYKNKQARQVLEPREQLINFDLSGLTPTTQTPTTFEWIVEVRVPAGLITTGVAV